MAQCKFLDVDGIVLGTAEIPEGTVKIEVPNGAKIEIVEAALEQTDGKGDDKKDEI